MTPLREAFVLPGLFLTVTLLGGLRIGASIQLIPPPLSAMVLAVVLLGALVRAGVIVPATLLDSGRRPQENLSGAVVLLTLVAASAQAIHLVVPDRGLLHILFVVFLFVQLISVSAAAIDRIGMLRSLFVLLGASFVLRFIVLENLYASDGGTLKRVLTALMAGVTLGGLDYQPNAAVTGYVGFVTLALYMIGLLLLPARPLATTSALSPTVRDGLPVPLVILMLLAGTAACQGAQERPDWRQTSPAMSGDSRPTSEQRDALLAAARVWTPPAVPPAQADFARNPDGPGRFDETEDVACGLVVGLVTGLTPKFDCRLPDGSVVKVKYGHGNAELYTEVAATRLLTALGFAADRMYVIGSVRCAGCPRFPYRAQKCLDATGLRWPCFPAGVDADRVESVQSGGHRTPARRPAHRGVSRSGVGLVRVGEDRSLARRLSRGRSGCVEAPRGVSGALGQQGREPTPHLSSRRRPARRRVRPARRDDARRGRHVWTLETGSAQLACSARLGRFRRLPGQHGAAPVAGGNVSGTAHLRGGTAVPPRAHRTTVRRSNRVAVFRVARPGLRRDQRRITQPGRVGRRVPE